MGAEGWDVGGGAVGWGVEDGEALSAGAADVGDEFGVHGGGWAEDGAAGGGDERDVGDGFEEGEGVAVVGGGGGGSSVGGGDAGDVEVGASVGEEDLDGEGEIVGEGVWGGSGEGEVGGVTVEGFEVAEGVDDWGGCAAGAGVGEAGEGGDGGGGGGDGGGRGGDFLDVDAGGFVLSGGVWGGIGSLVGGLWGRHGSRLLPWGWCECRG